MDEKASILTDKHDRTKGQVINHVKFQGLKNHLCIFYIVHCL